MTKPKDSIPPGSPLQKVKASKPILSTSGNLLALNENEGRWLSAILAPNSDGWFIFGLDGNPPFHIPVDLRFDGYSGFCGVGWRTPEIGADAKEKWIVMALPGMPGNARLTHWRPRASIRGKPAPARRGFWQRIFGGDR